MSENIRERFRRLPLRRMVEGGAIAVALWCTLYIFQLLPGRTADTEGVLLFAIAGAILRLTPIGKSLLPALTLCSLVVLAVSESSVSNAVASEWIRCDPIPDSGIAAVVVMSAGVNPNGTMSAEALDHLLTGLELTRGDSAPLLVTTTVQQMFPTGMVSSQTDQGRIVALAGGRRRWMRMRSTRSTRDEALTVGDSLLPRGMRRVAVVASPMHTRRACGAFAAVGFDVTCVAARSRLPGGASPGPWPRDRLTVFGDWVYEVAGTTKYRMKGWLDSGAERKSNVSPSMNPGTAAAAVAAPRHTWCE